MLNPYSTGPVQPWILPCPRPVLKHDAAQIGLSASCKNRVPQDTVLGAASCTMTGSEEFSGGEVLITGATDWAMVMTAPFLF